MEGCFKTFTQSPSSLWKGLTKHLHGVTAPCGRVLQNMYTESQLPVEGSYKTFTRSPSILWKGVTKPLPFTKKNNNNLGKHEGGT